MSDDDTAPHQPAQQPVQQPAPQPVAAHDPEAPQAPTSATQVADRPAYDASYGQPYALYPAQNPGHVTGQTYGPNGSPARPRFSDLVLGLRGVIAVALASLIIGGFGGWVLGSTTDDSGNGRGGLGGFGGPGGQFQRGNLPNGQAPGQGGAFTGTQPQPNQNQPSQ